jgi:WhiB family redox-sensing transcriptional regulator
MSGSRQGWDEDAACRDSDPEMFFPDSMDTDEAIAARSVCRSCPVARECFGFAVTNNIGFGIWGGYSPKQRTEAVRAARRKSVQDPKPEKGPRPPGGMAALNAAKTHCKYNHEFTEENTAYYRGRRRCITCHLARLERKRERRSQTKETAS